MPQVSAGRAGVRRPVFVLLVGLALMLLAHVVSCALHPGDEHPPAMAATVSSAHRVSGADAPPYAPHYVACSAAHGDDGHPGHGAACCDPADRPAVLRAAAGAPLLVPVLLAMVLLRRRATELGTSGAPPGGGDSAAAPAAAGLPLLRLVCVSRT